MFAVDGLTFYDECFRANMATGPWSSGIGGPGSLGVLADNVLGYALVGAAPEHLWSVSTEISIDFCRPLPTDGTQLSAEGRVTHVLGAAGLAEGSIVDEKGQLVARCRQWGRFVEQGLDPARINSDDRSARGRSSEGGRAVTIREQVTASEGHAELRGTVNDDLANPIGTLHGGVALWAVELTASSALSSLTPALSTTSLTTAYLRPLPRGEVATFRAEVVSSGNRVGLTQVTGFNQAGKRSIVAMVQHQSTR